MESVKKWLAERTVKKNGFYAHYSPPKLVGATSEAQLRQWARGGSESRLERAVLAGQGRRLLAVAEALPLAHHLPALVAKCDALHAAVERGSLVELQELLDSDYNRRKYIMCRDEAGVSLLHKAVFYDYMDIATWLVHQCPELVHEKDSVGRTPLHYASVCRDEAFAAALLETAGAARGARDAVGRTPAHYRGAARTQLSLPAPEDMPRDNAKNPPGLVIKRHNIRIWCHDCDMARLQRVVWEGHGSRLLSEVSNQPVVKKFLEAVPYIMNTIRDIHNAVIQNDLEDLMKHSGDPVPPQALSSRDINNLTVMHKAAGLGHGGILKYLAERYPQGINDVDNEGRTPLHYAAAVRDEQHTFNTLVSYGADESITDNKNKTPGYYVNRPQEIDKNLFKSLPDAPRTASSAYPSSWDWKLLDTEVIAELNKKSRRKNLKASSENISSKNHTNTISESTDTHVGMMKTSSTRELIKDLPDLDDNIKSNKLDNPLSENHQDTEATEDKINDEPTSEKEETKELHTEEMKEDNEELSEKEKTDDNNEEPAEEEILDDKNTNIDNANEEKAHAEAQIDNKNYENKGNDENQEESRNDITDESNDEEKHEETTEADNPNKEKQDIQHDNTEEIDSGDNGDTSKTPDVQNDNHQHEENNLNNNNKDDDSEENENNNATEEQSPTSKEGKYSSEHNEDDDDVQVQGDSNSEYSDINHQSTADIVELECAKRGNVSEGRNTQESLIEGIISGEAEQESQAAMISERDGSMHKDILVVDSEIDPEVTDLINNANMEMLATLVLNGEGTRLVGRQSGNTELQAFLDNVPTYMQKINKVHLAAREGNIKDLQAALDRRKFAIARDPISPNGATPLHVATVFGKTNIMKYLGGRFPETLSAVDFEGRTSLHYAAVLPDNGHYYNLLQQLGSNSKDLDDKGRSAEDYIRNPNLLPFSQLLSNYGISEDAVQDMLSDKGSSHATNGHMDIPIFQTEEGRYLAKSLGDPLIKGLTEVANVKPKDPVAFLASFLQNFPDHEKPHLGTQESKMVVTREMGEVENDQPPPIPPPVVNGAIVAAARAGTRTATRPRPIDVVTVDPQPEASPDGPEAAFSSANRDEHGQSMLHFAAARSHSRNALFQLLQESDVSLGYRDELYRTARDVSIQANVPENTTEIDKWVLHLTARGNKEKIMELLLEGYDHILDVVDEEGAPILDVITQRGDSEMGSLLASIPTFEESRDTLHGAIRRGDLAAVQEQLSVEGGRTLARGMNTFGRTAVHVAVLAQHEEIVAYLAQTFPELLRIGDNLERTPLHYAMGVEKMESLSRVLIRAGAKRVLKDLKGRQPSYYFMNKSDILRLKEEEQTY